MDLGPPAPETARSRGMGKGSRRGAEGGAGKVAAYPGRVMNSDLDEIVAIGVIKHT